MTVDRAVFLTAVAGLLIVTGVEIGEARARQQIATVCEPQPSTVMVSSIQSSTGLVCIYTDQIQSGRAHRPAKPKAKST